MLSIFAAKITARPIIKKANHTRAKINLQNEDSPQFRQLSDIGNNFNIGNRVYNEFTELNSTEQNRKNNEYYHCILKLENVQVQNSFAFGSGLSVSAGGGLFVSSTSLQIKNSDATTLGFQDNMAGTGGAIAGIDSCMLLDDVLFKNNIGHRMAGAIYASAVVEIEVDSKRVNNYLASESVFICRGCNFNTNKATELGGAVFVQLFGDTYFEKVTFTGNLAGSSGGACYCSRTAPKFFHCFFLNNIAGQREQFSMFLTTNTKYIGNVRRTSDYGLSRAGGAIVLNSGSIEVSMITQQCCFNSNNAYNIFNLDSNGKGQDVHLHGKIQWDSFSDAFVAGFVEESLNKNAILSLNKATKDTISVFFWLPQDSLESGCDASTSRVETPAELIVVRPNELADVDYNSGVVEPTAFNYEATPITRLPYATTRSHEFTYKYEGTEISVPTLAANIKTFSVMPTPAATPSLSVSPTPSLSISPSPSVSVSPTPSLSVSPSPSLSISPSLSVSPSPSPSQSPSVSVSPTPSLSVSPTATATPSHSISPTPSVSVSPTPSVSVSPTPSVSVSPTPSVSVSPTPSVSVSPSPSVSVSPTPSLSISPTPSLSISPTPSVSPHPTPTPEPTPDGSPWPTRTATPSASPYPTQTPSLSVSPTPSVSVSPSPSVSVSPSPSLSVSPSPSGSPSRSPSLSVSPTESPDPTRSVSPTQSPHATRSPSMSPDPTQSPTASKSPIPSASRSPYATTPGYNSEIATVSYSIVVTESWVITYTESETFDKTEDNGNDVFTAIEVSSYAPTIVESYTEVEDISITWIEGHLGAELPTKNDKLVPIIAGVIGGLLLLILLVIMIWYIIRRKNGQVEMDDEDASYEEEEDILEDIDNKMFTLYSGEEFGDHHDDSNSDISLTPTDSDEISLSKMSREFEAPSEDML